MCIPDMAFGKRKKKVKNVKMIDILSCLCRGVDDVLFRGGYLMGCSGSTEMMLDLI